MSHILEYVLNVFKTLVWKKFFSYSSEDMYYMNDNWLQLARRLPRNTFIIWLAYQVADDILKNINHNVKIDDLLNSVDSDSSIATQHSAELFIENYYFGYPSFDPHYQKLIFIFRKILKRKLENQMVKKVV
jgi:hypothetical protein